MDWRDHIASQVRGDMMRDMRLAPRVSVRVGGPASLIVKPADADDLVSVLAAARAVGKQVWILGGGANTVVGDGGWEGVVVKLPAWDSARVEDLGDSMLLDIPAGAPSARLVQLAREHGLLGAEWAAGIPGTIGGMTAMNAGTRAGEMKDNVVEVCLANHEGLRWMPASELRFAYRHADLQGDVVARVRCRMAKGTPGQVTESLAAMDKDRDYRKRTQPLQLPNSGSVFRNPPGEHAGRLIEAAGLKGSREGGAQISERHANFIVNRGGATARDVTTLMARAQQAVLKKAHILLALEVRLVGVFAPSADVLGLAVQQ